jgi:hypothetical protein
VWWRGEEVENLLGKSVVGAFYNNDSNACLVLLPQKARFCTGFLIQIEIYLFS